MAKRKIRKMTAEERAEWEARSERVSAMLQERIEYYEERLRRKAERRRWFPWRVRIERVR